MRTTSVATLGMLLVTAGAAVAVPGVTPATVERSLDPGGSAVIAKSVETPEIPPLPDIVLMADTTGSMGPAISNVKSNATSIMTQVQAEAPGAQFAVAEYRDVGHAPLFAINQTLTSSTSAAQAAINTWNAFGGGDEPEAWINALVEISNMSYRTDSTRVLVMFGDARSHDPSNGRTEAQAIAALQAKGIRVIAISVTTFGSGLNASGQAGRITAATDGVLTTAGPSEVADTILEELQNLPALVEPSTTCDDPGVSLTFDPASSEVTSGETAEFEETVVVGAGAPQGGTVVCTTDFLVNGVSAGPAFVETTTVHVNDITPPVVTVESKVVEATSPAGAVVDYLSSAEDNVDGPLTPTCAPPSGSQFALGVTATHCEATDSSGLTGEADGTIEVVDTTPPSSSCEESTNPGGNTPQSGKNPSSGQNPDGFYALVATDVADPDPEVFLRDTGSGHVFGPYASGQKIKYTQASSGPSEKPKPGGIIHLKGTGDGETYAVDASGNTSDPAACLVPRPPR